MNRDFNPLIPAEARKPLLVTLQLLLLVVGETGALFFGHAPIFGIFVLAYVAMWPLVSAREAQEKLPLGFSEKPDPFPLSHGPR